MLSAGAQVTVKPAPYPTAQTSPEVSQGRYRSCPLAPAGVDHLAGLVQYGCGDTAALHNHRTRSVLGECLQCRDDERRAGDCGIRMSRATMSSNITPTVDPARLHVIHRGVDPAVFPKGFTPREAWLADWIRRYPQLRDRYVITLPGRVGARKGVFDFIALIAGLKHAGHDVHGLIVGEIAKRDRKLAGRLDSAAKPPVLPMRLPVPVFARMFARSCRSPMPWCHCHVLPGGLWSYRKRGPEPGDPGCRL